MWYCITGTDHPESLERRMAARPQHLARLEALLGEGRLLLAGPFPAIDAEQQQAPFCWPGRFRRSMPNSRARPVSAAA